MATLFNTKIKDTYQSLLKLEDNTILTTTSKNITDGLGNASPLYLSTTQVRIGSNSGSAMYWDNTNNRLGIGTSSPTQSIETPNAIVFASANNDSKTTLKAFDAATGNIDFTNEFIISRQGTNLVKMFFNNTIGIGGIGSAAKLGVRGSGSTSATTSLLVQNSGGTNLLQVKDNGDAVIYGDNNTWGQGYGYLLRQSGGIIYGSNHNSVTLKSAVSWNLQNNSGSIGASNGTIDYSSTNTPNVEQTNILRASQYQHGVGEGRFLIQAQANAGGYNAIGNMYIAGGRNTNGGAHGNVYLGVDLTGALGNVGIGTSSPTNPLDIAYSPGRLISFKPRTGYLDFGQIVFSSVTGAEIISSGSIGLGPSDTYKTLILGNGITSKITTPGSTKYDGYGNQTPSTLAGSTNQPVLFTSTIPEGNIDGFIFENTSSGSRNLFKLIQNNTTLLTVNPNGNLLLGTTTDNGAKLRIEGGDLSITGYQPKIIINGTATGQSYMRTNLAVEGYGLIGGIGLNTDIWLVQSAPGGVAYNIPATIHFKVNGTNPLTSATSHWLAGDNGKSVGYEFLTTHYRNSVPAAWFGPEISGGVVGLQQFNIGYEPKQYAGAGFTFVGVGLSGVVSDPFTRTTEFNPIRIDYSLASGGSNITARGVYYNPTFTSVYPLLVNNAFESTSGSLVMSGAASRVSSGISRGAYLNQTLRPANMSGDVLVGLDINPTFTSSATQISTFSYVGGSGYTQQTTWTNIPLTGGTGTGATVNITVGAGFAVTAVTMANRGTGYTVNDVLTLPAQNIFTHNAGGSGFSVTVTAVGASTYNAYGLLVRSGNVGIGTSSPTAQLQVQGSGSTSATTSLLVQNSGGTQLLKLSDDGTTTIGNSNNTGDYTFVGSNIVVLKLNDTLNSRILAFYKNSGSNYIADTNSDTRLSYGWSGNYFWRLNGSTKSMAMSSTTSDPTADASAIVDFQSTTKGFLPPRLTTTQKNAIATPAEGLMVYDTDLKRPCFFNGTSWITL